MGIFATMGKLAGSKIAEKVGDELTKKQNQEQTNSYCKYIKTNLARVSKMIAELECETKALIEQLQDKKGVKLSFKDKANFRKTKEKIIQNLGYLYLIRDFFTTLAKNASGLVLKNEELMLVTKFSPYFDGVPVLSIDDENRDASLLGEFKEVAQEMKSMFISSKKGSNHFEFAEYLHRYSEKIEEFIMPDIDSAIENFNSALAAQENIGAVAVESPAAVTAASSKKIECPNCHAKLAADAKFCPECGKKIEIKKSAFCPECGTPISPDSKFCSSCGTRIS